MVVNRPAAPVLGRGDQVGDLRKARLRYRAKFLQGVGFFAAPLAGSRQKALQQLFQSLLTVKGNARMQRRYGKTCGSGVAIDIGDFQPFLDRGSADFIDKPFGEP